MKSLQRRLLDEKLDRLFSRLEPGHVLDAGGMHSPYKEKIPSTQYTTLDINESFKPDLCCDIHKIKAKDNSFDTIIATELLEHCYSPSQAVCEMRRVLKKGGVCIASVPFIFQYHADQDTKDYYRFSKDGLGELFKDFSKVEITPFGSVSTTLILLLSSKLGFLNWLNGLFFRTRFGNMPSGFVVFAIK